MPGSHVGAFRAAPDSDTRNGDAVIHSLPNELLADIFQLGHRTYDTSDENVMRYLSAISSVCRIWRDVALNVSSLWTNIVYEERSDMRAVSRGLSRVEERIATCILRSRNSSLAIRLWFGHYGRGLAQLKDMISPHLSRCRSIDVEFAYGHQASQLFPLPGRLDRLTALSCKVRLHDSTSLVLFSADDGPRLQDMSLLMRGVHAHFPSASIHVEHLTKLRLGGDYRQWQDPIRFVSRCHSLRYLKLAIYPLGPFPPFTLPKLSHLQTFGLGFASIIHTPNLQSLTIFDALDAGSSGDTPVVPPTLCLPSLRVLRFLEVDVMRPDVGVFLESNPTIEVLQLFRCGPLSQDSYESDSDEALWVEDGQSVMGVMSVMSDGTDRGFLPSLKLLQTPWKVGILREHNRMVVRFATRAAPRRGRGDPGWGTDQPRARRPHP